jgi:hypothetical protein
MHGVLFAELAVFAQFQAGFVDFLVFVGKMGDPFAFGALEFDHVILGHSGVFAKLR